MTGSANRWCVACQTQLCVAGCPYCRGCKSAVPSRKGEDKLITNICQDCQCRFAAQRSTKLRCEKCERARDRKRQEERTEEAKARDRARNAAIHQKRMKELEELRRAMAQENAHFEAAQATPGPPALPSFARRLQFGLGGCFYIPGRTLD